MDVDARFWDEALACARQAVGLSEPNPRVGCVLVNAQGEVLGRGHTQAAGQAHAEVMALRDAHARGLAVVGGTAFVTLEPCSHHGRTPPCVDALLSAGLAGVKVALADPNPRVAGQGVARLRAAGVTVSVLPTDHPVAHQARELNLGFLSRMVRQRPWVRLKVAASLDGRTALPGGQSQWITSPQARADGHAWRARATAVLTGMGTVRDDNPRLDVREAPVVHQPWRVVLDSRWTLPTDAALLGGTPASVWVLGLEPSDLAARQRHAALGARGVNTQVVPAAAGTEAGVALDAALAALAALGVNELHVEAGARLTGAFLAQGLADELLVYLAPRLIGPGRPMADLPVLESLAVADGLCFAWTDVRQVGPDVRLMARRTGPLAF